jgi:ribosomal protein S7
MLNKNFIKKKNLYKTLLGFLIKKGNLISAKNILNNTFSIIFKKTGYSKESALLKLFLVLNSFVEVKKVRVRRRFVLVPFSISLKRRSYLIVRWLMKTVNQDTRRESLSEKLSHEIINILKGLITNTKKAKVLNISQAIANRSNIHYRW